MPENKAYGELFSVDEIAQKLLDVVKEIAQNRNLIQPQKIAAAQTENIYRLAKSKAMLTADEALLKEGFPKITESMREAYTIRETAGLRANHQMAEAMAAATYQKLQALYHELTAYQSLLKEFRDERKFAGNQTFENDSRATTAKRSEVGDEYGEDYAYDDEASYSEFYDLDPSIDYIP